MSQPTLEKQRARSSSPRLGFSALVGEIAQDVSELTKSELALAKTEIEVKLHDAALSFAASVLGATVALFGFAMLCATAVVALAPVMPALWARMLLVSVIYLLFGGGFAFLFLIRLRRAASNVRAPLAMRNARETIEAVRGELKHG